VKSVDSLDEKEGMIMFCGGKGYFLLSFSSHVSHLLESSLLSLGNSTVSVFCVFLFVFSVFVVCRSSIDIVSLKDRKESLLEAKDENE
jgi:hypothetical protein